MPAVTVECLEEKRLYSVGYYVSSGSLIVYGDSSANDISVDVAVGSTTATIRVSGTSIGTASGLNAIYLYGYGDNDILDLTGVNNAALNCQAYGGDADDVIRGSGGNNYLWGGSGDDRIEGFAGDDFINGEDGDDYDLDGGNGNDTIYGGYGNDNIYLGDGNDQAYGGDGTDYFYEIDLRGSDYVDGGAGTDYVPGGYDGTDNVYNL